MRTIKVDLTSKGLESLVRQLEGYAKTLDEKNERFLELLLECGIKKAEQSIATGTHHMPERISFYKEFESDGHSIKGIMVGVGETFPSHWYDADGVEHNDEVYPLAMMEFGSAGYAVPPANAYGGYGGKGTFSVSGHEDDYSWWIVTEIDSEGKPVAKKLGTAVEPTSPMYHAMEEMKAQIRDCARKAFGG